MRCQKKYKKTKNVKVQIGIKRMKMNLYFKKIKVTMRCDAHNGVGTKVNWNALNQRSKKKVIKTNGEPWLHCKLIRVHRFIQIPCEI
jgi:hypothetical protein